MRRCLLIHNLHQISRRAHGMLIPTLPIFFNMNLPQINLRILIKILKKPMLGCDWSWRFVYFLFLLEFLWLRFYLCQIFLFWLRKPSGCTSLAARYFIAKFFSLWGALTITLQNFRNIGLISSWLWPCFLLNQALILLNLVFNSSIKSDLQFIRIIRITPIGIWIPGWLILLLLNIIF